MDKRLVETQSKSIDIIKIDHENGSGFPEGQFTNARGDTNFTHPGMVLVKFSIVD